MSLPDANLAALERLIDPVGGLIASIDTLRAADVGGPDFDIRMCLVGSPGILHPALAKFRSIHQEDDPLGGAGADEDERWAKIRAIAEAAERYALVVLDNAECVVDSAQGLGSAALDLDTVPRCSARELADPRCPLIAPQKDAPQRWVPGFDMVSGKSCMVPAIMTHLLLPEYRAENFWLPISTGVAAHFDLDKALWTAFCEVVERDAIAGTWLARPDLPEIVLDGTPAEEMKFRRLLASGVEQRMWDATSDMGVPTVYAVQLTDNHPTLGQFVSCAADASYTVAAAKTIREAAAGRLKFEHANDIPADIADFTRLVDGATHMGAPSRRDGFDFLLKASRRIGLGTLEAATIGRVGHMQAAVERCRRLGMQLIVADLTTDELREIGLWVVRVIVPQLLPMSPVHRARYLGHPRLYDLAALHGRAGFSEADVNPHPQPFA